MHDLLHDLLTAMPENEGVANLAGLYLRGTMKLDVQIILNAVSAVLLAGAGWWLNNLWAMVKSLQEQVSAVHIKMVEQYVPRTELQSTFQRIFDKLDEIQKGLGE